MIDPTSDFARHAKEWWDVEKAKQNGRKVRKKKIGIGYGVAYGKALCFLNLNTANSPNTEELAGAILRHKGISGIVSDKIEAKSIIMAFAETSGFGKTPKRSVVKQDTQSIKKASPQDFYWSDEWRRVRYIALRASRGLCELCGAGPSPGKPLHVDHIKPRSRYPELELDSTNLQVLCFDCNLGKSNTDTIDWRKK